MRRILIGVLTLVAGLAGSPLNAGVYLTAELVPEKTLLEKKALANPFQFFRPGPQVGPEGVEPLPHALFQNEVYQGLLMIPNDKLPNNGIRAICLELRDELARKERRGQATEADLVNLSALLIRLGEPNKAVEVLTQRGGRSSRNFMILSNLATATYLADPGDPTREGQPGSVIQAVEYLGDALHVWPTEWPGLTAEQLRWYRRADETLLALLRARRRELLKPAKEPRGVDSLFGPREDPLRFVGESGQYEPGKLAAAEQAKLPPDAVALVQQLLVWMPNDTRLLWQYGELLGAQGDIKTAHSVLDYCLYARAYNSKELLEHRQQLSEAVAAAAAEARRIGWLPESSQMLAVGTGAALIVLTLVFFQFRILFRRGSAAAGKG